MKIKNIYVIILILFTSLSKYSYSQQTEDILGDWKIIKVELAQNAKQEEQKMMGVLKSLFSKSTFHFKKDSLFSFDAPDKALAIKNAFWKFDSTKNYIKVTEKASPKKGDQLMGIKVKIVDGVYLFTMEETPIILTVKKSNG